MSDLSKMNKALAMAEAGMRVFPCVPNGKRPLTEHGQDDGTTDRETIIKWWTRWPDANIGLATEASRLYVVDIDCKPDKNGVPAPGFESWAALTAEHDVPETFTVRTWSGGLHLYFWMPEKALKNSASKLGKGIDTRGNGYVIAPPSEIDGKKYEVVNAVSIKPLPDWIAERLAPREKPVKVHKPVQPGERIIVDPAVLAATGEVVDRVRALAKELEEAPEGSGNDTAARVAFMVGQYVGAGQIDDTTAIGILLDAISGWSYAQGIDARVMESTIIRQVSEGANSPRPWEAAQFQGGTVAEQQDQAFIEVTEEEETESTPSGADGPASDWGTDDGQARYLLRYIGGMLYVIGLGWHIWDGTRWLAVDERRIACILKAFYKKRFDYFLTRYRDQMKEADNDRAKMYSKFMQTNRLANIMKAMERIEPVDVNALDSHPDLLNTPQGVVDLRDGTLQPHDPALLITKVTKGNYRPGFTHPDWEMALTSLPEDVRDYFQIRVGQAATGHIPNSDDALFLQGNGANGKSMMTSDGVMRALGDFAMLASPGLILAKKDAGGATPERASVRGARFVLIEELPEGRSLSIEEVKRITGTSQITARMLYKDEMTFSTSHTLFVTTNYLPTVNETDDGSWRRLCLINFPYRFRSQPTLENERKGDSGLKDRVRQGKDGQHDAIVTWIVDGAMKWYANPLSIDYDERPIQIEMDTMSWRKKADRILAYFEDRIVADPNGRIAKPDLYHDFCTFLSVNGHAKWSQETFVERMKNHELFKKFAVTEGQSKTHDGLSRPLPPGTTFTSDLPVLPKSPRVYKGITFRVD